MPFSWLQQQMTFIPIFALFYLPSLSLAALPMTIQNISAAETIDLYDMYNNSPLNTLLQWNFWNAKGPIVRAFSTFNETVEIMAGPAEEASNYVVDVAATNLVYSTANYWFPASLPLGLYHYRINATVNTSTSDTFEIQNVTARSATINVTTSEPIGCGKRIPPPYHNITSLSDPNYTSLYVYEPSAGFNAHATFSNRTYVSWAYRDARNEFDGKDVSNFTVQVIDAVTSNPVGPLQTPDKKDFWGYGMSFKVSENDVPLVLGGTYKLVVKYRNSVQDGVVPPGEYITHTSEMFNYVTFEDFADNCKSLAAKEAAGPGNSSTGSTGKQGNTNTAGGTKVTSFWGLWLSFLVLVVAVPYPV